MPAIFPVFSLKAFLLLIIFFGLCISLDKCCFKWVRVLLSLWWDCDDFLIMFRPRTVDFPFSATGNDMALRDPTHNSNPSQKTTIVKCLRSMSSAVDERCNVTFVVWFSEPFSQSCICVSTNISMRHTLCIAHNCSKIPMTSFLWTCTINSERVQYYGIFKKTTRWLNNFMNLKFNLNSCFIWVELIWMRFR